MTSIDNEGTVVKMGRAEIDTRAPFKSVREAVALFGDKFGEVYGNKLKEIGSKANESGQAQSRVAALTIELEETKQSLEKAKAESNLMAYRIQSLREELERAKKELRQLKAKEYLKQPMDHEIEDIKFIENPPKFESRRYDNVESSNEFQKKRYVSFASPPSLTRVIVNKDEVMESSPSAKKTKKKPLVPVIAWLFSKKKGNHTAEYSRV